MTAIHAAGVVISPPNSNFTPSAVSKSRTMLSGAPAKETAAGCSVITVRKKDAEERVKRLYENRGYSEVKSYSIIHNQLSVTEFKKACDYLIDNGGSLEHVREQIAARLHAV